MLQLDTSLKRDFFIENLLFHRARKLYFWMVSFLGKLTRTRWLLWENALTGRIAPFYPSDFSVKFLPTMKTPVFFRVGLLWSIAAILLLAAVSPPLQAQDYIPLDGLRVSDGRVQFGFASAGQCIQLSNSSINGVVYTTHTSKWQRRAGSSWVDIPGTERNGLCSYSPTSLGEYRLVAEISINGERGHYSSENTLTVGGEAFAPADQAAFDGLVVGKRMLMADPDPGLNFVDFISPGRYSETSILRTLGTAIQGSYSYEKTGSNTGTVSLNYDSAFPGGGGSLRNCTVQFQFDSRTTGWLAYDCSGWGPFIWPWQLIDIPGAPTTLYFAGTESILLANFVNGNTDAFNSRVYLWNPSGSSGDVTVRVFTLPLTGGLAQELTTAPLNLGPLGAKSALNVKVAEDILAPLGITLPYTNNEGDLTLEFTIEVADVRGATQVFSSSLAFGTHPLQEIPSTSSGSPTVLVANFMNGNSDAFNSRAHLFNPSDSDGNVTVRVFTLPLSDGTAQELTGTPLDLGTLEARSALNIKLAEDILTPLGITTPYTTDGGNLTLEFTIQAADVRGAAQVFSSSFAFGVYPLQEIPSTSSGSPTVLVANFMNGNSDAFSSRAYLFNPSDSDGNVTVRVFTLPLDHRHSPGADRYTTGFGNPGSTIGTQPQTGRRYPHPSGNRTALCDRRG